jgi:hypothetical protein
MGISVYAWLHFCHIQHCVTFSAQADNDLAIYALVGEQVHATIPAIG